MAAPPQGQILESSTIAQSPDDGQRPRSDREEAINNERQSRPRTDASQAAYSLRPSPPSIQMPGAGFSVEQRAAVIAG
jgi:hypothetical protein